MGAQVKHSPCDLHDIDHVAVGIWESRISAFERYFDPASDDADLENFQDWEAFLGSDNFQNSKYFQDSVMFFQQLTGVPSGLDSSVGYFTSDPGQLQEIVHRWEAWRAGRKADQEFYFLVCLVDRDVKSRREYLKLNSRPMDLFVDLWIGFGNTMLPGSLERHGVEDKRHSVLVVSLDYYGGLSLLQWELEDRSPSAVDQAFGRPPDAAVLGIWTPKEDNLLSVRFFILEENLSGSSDDQRPDDFMGELIWAEKELSFLGNRFDRVSPELNDVPVWRQISRLRREHKRSLLWLR
jgi:hypothetical protein